MVNVRPVTAADFDVWKLLRDGHNTFYGRKDDTALPVDITQSTWKRFPDPADCACDGRRT